MLKMMRQIWQNVQTVSFCNLRNDIHRAITDSIFDKRNLCLGIRVANTQLIVQLFFRAFLRGKHLVIVISRGEVRLEHDIIEQLLAGCEQNIDLCAPGIVLGL